MSKTDTPVAEHIVEATTIHVRRTIKLGEDSETSESDKSGEGDTEIIEVHKFAVTPAVAEAGLSIRKSQQADNGDWVAGEITIRVHRPCYMEELEAGTEAAYELVKDAMGVHMKKMLKALDQLSKR